MKAWLLALLFVLCYSAAASAGADDLEAKIKQAVDAFKQNFLNRPPFNQYILSVQFTTLEEEKQYNNDVQLSHDETWSSWCLDVTVGLNLPQSIKDALPPTFWEFKVFYNPVGTTPYDPSKSSSNAISEESSEESSEEPMMCTMIAYMCPDGSVAQKTRTCENVCVNLTYDEVDEIRESFSSEYPDLGMVSIETLFLKDVVLLPNENANGYCLVAAVNSDDISSRYPEVYHGVRVFYYAYVCTDRVCEDGSIVNCDAICPEEEESSSAILVPLSAIIFVVTLSTCCCYLKRRTCRAHANKAAPAQEKREVYPSEQYELLKHQEEQAIQEAQMAMMMSPHMMPHNMMPMPPMMMPVTPQMAAQMGLPPMPPVPHMLPNGQMPIMVQAPNGMWFPAPAHPEDETN